MPQAQKKTMMLVDVNNLYHGMRYTFGKKLNYSHLIEFAREEGDVVKMVAYGSHLEYNNHKFVAALRHLGFEVKMEALNDNDVLSKAHVQMTLDMFQGAHDGIEKFILVTSDGILAGPLAQVKKWGKETLVVGVEISNKLADISEFYEIGEDEPGFFQD